MLDCCFKWYNIISTGFSDLVLEIHNIYHEKDWGRFEKKIIIHEFIFKHTNIIALNNINGQNVYSLNLRNWQWFNNYYTLHKQIRYFKIYEVWGT